MSKETIYTCDRCRADILIGNGAELHSIDFGKDYAGTNPEERIGSDLCGQCWKKLLRFLGVPKKEKKT